MDLSARSALVTGSTKGIGRAIAEALVDAGANVAINSRTDADIEEAVEALRERTGDHAGTGNAGVAPAVVGICADVANPDDCTRLVTDAAEALGGLDILINNAGMGIFKSIEEMTWEEWRTQIDVNLGGVWACTKAALPFLKEAGQREHGGWVINIGSLAGRHTFAGATGYNAAKFGLMGLTEATMLDIRQHGIRVSVVMPGSVNTSFGTREQEPERDWRLQAEDCALAVMQLLAFPKGAHVSRVEMRPAMPRK